MRTAVKGGRLVARGVRRSAALGAVALIVGRELKTGAKGPELVW